MTPVQRIAMPILRKLASLTHQSLTRKGATYFANSENYARLIEHFEYLLRYDLGKSYPESTFSANNQLHWCWQLLPEHTNLIHCYPSWTIALMLIKEGHPEQAMLIDANGDEYLAAIGNGSHYGNQRIRVNQRITSQLLWAGDRQLPGIGREIGSPILSICQTARGSLDAVCFSGLNEFTIRFAHTILGQAGARCTNFSGEEITATDQLIAAEANLHRRLLIKLFKVKTEVS